MSSAPDTDPELADMTIDEIVAHNERHGGALTIEYKGYQIVVPRRDIEDAIAFIRDIPPRPNARTTPPRCRARSTRHGPGSSRNAPARSMR